MRTPPLLLGAALLFWGFETGLTAVGAVLGIALEASRLVRRRWDFGVKEFGRVSDIGAVLLLILTVYLYITQPATAAFVSLVKLVPLVVYPLIFAQAISVRNGVDAAALFMSMRRRAAVYGPGPLLDVSRPFLPLCILAAGAANVQTPVFYAGMFGLFAWFFWAERPRYARVPAWLALLLLAGALGYAGQASLRSLQVLLEGKAAGFIFGSAEVSTDPYRSHTAIGQLGALKEYGGIMLRIPRPASGQAPRLLREASFDSYRSGEWRAREASFSGMPLSAAGGGWTVSPGPGAEKLTIYSNFANGKGLLAMPAGARAVFRLPGAELSRNRLGAVRAEGAPVRVGYEVVWDQRPGPSRDSPPGPGDLAMPEEEAPLVRRIAGELGLARRPPAKALGALGDYFAKDFRYSLYQATEGVNGVSPVARFLTETHAGHCEFFATSSVLLLRAAGIPARYAVGYSVQEYSRLQRSYLVRQRHAHAWALAYVNGAWLDVDNTPAAWFEAEASHAGMLEPLGDIWSWLTYKFFLLRPALQARGARAAAWLLAIVVLYALWKTVSGFFRKETGGGGAAGKKEAAAQGLDSELYAVEKALAADGLGRRPWETMGTCICRIGNSGAVMGTPELERLGALHTRLRFDPSGLPPEEREILREGARIWMKEHRKRKVQNRTL